MLAAACLLGCGFVTPALAEDYRLTMEINETHRFATINQPRRLKHIPRATLIVLHGAENGQRIRARLGLDTAVAGTGTVTVYPDALNGHWNNGLSEAAGPDDVAFLKALIAKLVSAGITDSRRVYLVGASDGGVMALRFTCEADHLLAGTATVLTAMPVKLAQTCKLTKPTPYLSINGTDDSMVPFNGGTAIYRKTGKNEIVSKGDVISAAATLDIFAKKAGCGAEKHVKQLEDRDKEDKSQPFLETFDACQVPVEMIRIEGGGHNIPGRRLSNIGPAAGNGTPNHDIESSRVIWDFFRRTPAR